ncbi:hypothetical protein FFLO_04216 [Filobasidium floriforme]|uniref:Enoyl reductase (ER) domain-containing protein n=1 Tax=Filobasidium floriforme TaxID=5210 RepID=A0A8K0NQ43_9TREE|nr:GroES-like protein [Filobasidium floriforme]KAG7531632.1 hypothetical protein FFLO_04216 [Filobasidium floriforme]KAH8090852.1 GroES-like protein [Filobasidium floriforme]
MSLPKTYKALQQKEKGKPFEMIDVEMKQPEKRQVVVKVLACGVCRSDDLVKEEMMPVLPRIPGHEIIGDVVAVGDGVEAFEVGDRVGSGWHGSNCLACVQCAKGDYPTCKNEGINGILTDGGYAEYVTLDFTGITKIPKELDPAQAPLFCSGVTTFNSMRNMGLQPGAVVAIQGLGGLGHLGVQFAAKSGFKTVALSSSDSKKDLAKELGAHVYVDGSKEDQAEALNKLGGADLIMCTAPNADIIKKLIGGLAVNGTLLILAVVGDDLQIPSMPLIQKRLSVRGWPSGSPRDSLEAIQFALDQGIKCYVEKYPLEKAEEAYESMMSGKARFRSVLIPNHQA